MTKRKICVVTGTRAEYGLLYWLIKEIDQDPDLELQLCVTGMHLSSLFGMTYKIIEQDGFKIDEKIDMKLIGDTPVEIAGSMGVAIKGFADALKRLQPDIMVVLGDRYEILTAAQAAMIAKIPLAHIHGGESTEGLIDEPIRHSLTKMSHFHFVAADEYKKRVVQLGEHPERVYNFGAIGLDNIVNLKLLSKDDFEESINFKLGNKSFLVTYHPVTLSRQSPEVPFKEFLEALDYFTEYKILFTMPNSDTHGRILIQMIQEYAVKNPQRVFNTVSLGQLRYLSAIKHVDAVIGNSSSGLIEVPALGKPTVNVGLRQRGRLRASSVVDCRAEKEDIIKAINKVTDKDFKKSLNHIKTPYGKGGVSLKIKEVLKKVSLDSVLMKKFYNLDFKL